MNKSAAMQIVRRRGAYCLAWLCVPVGRAARSLVSLGGLKECFLSAEGSNSESRSRAGLTRSLSLACAGRGFSISLIWGLLGLLVLLLSKVSAAAFASAFGDCRSARSAGCYDTAKGHGKNFQVRGGCEDFVGTTLISSILRRQS